MPIKDKKTEGKRVRDRARGPELTAAKQLKRTVENIHTLAHTGQTDFAPGGLLTAKCTLVKT